MAADLDFMEKQLHVLTAWVEALKEKEARIKNLQEEVQRLQQILNETRN
jgi:hypothetical protein